MWLTGFHVLLLFLAANGSPVLGKRLLGDRWAWPVDGGRLFADGRPLLGPSKTWRGIVLSLLTTEVVAVLLGYSLGLGFAFAAASMAGDMTSSFVKRRLGAAPSSRFLGLDQIPEAVLPMLVCREALGLDWSTLLVLTVLFFTGSLLLSWIMFRLGIKDQPY